MYQLKLFTMQIVPLAFCFGVAYWLMVTAVNQEEKLRSLGNTLGWCIIAVAMLSSVFAYYLLNNGGFCHDDFHQYQVKPLSTQDYGPSHPNERAMQHNFKQGPDGVLMNPELPIPKKQAAKK